ncbi:MAG: hypothetical protein H6852_08900 [Geminicoccaceae bacterium]|nr:hypothetical protein [Geminicoccaceae bacterium]MCB9967736.1 hypothetical protein [Geminicoccaceae bacterium]
MPPERRRFLLMALAAAPMAACTGDRAPPELPPDAITGPVFPIDQPSALAIARAALETRIRPDLIEAMEHPWPGWRGWLRFVIGLDSLTLFIVPGQGLDTAGNTVQGHAFAAWYDGSYDPGGRAVAREVLDHAAAAAGRPLAPLPER